MPEGRCRVIESDGIMGRFKLGKHLDDHVSKAKYRPGSLPCFGHSQRGQGMKSAMDKGITVEKDKQWFIIGHLRRIIIPLFVYGNHLLRLLKQSQSTP